MKKVPLHRIGVQRNGVTVYPEVGKAFDFSADEISELTNLSEKTKIEYFRDPVNEVGQQGSSSTAGDDSSAMGIIRGLLKDAGNLNEDGKLKMDVLTAALKAAHLPKMSAAQRDDAVAEIEGGNGL